MMDTTPTTDQKPITIRFPPSLVEAIKAMADEQQRSFNGEVVWLLLQATEEQRNTQQSTQSKDNAQRPA